MKKISLFVLTLFMVLNSQAQVSRPKLIVGLVVDQMRWDYLYFYQNEYGQGGLRRLLNEGFSFENTQINYAPTVTAMDTRLFLQGRYQHCMAFVVTASGRNDQYVYCCTDTTVRSVGSDSKEGQMSPHRLLTTTIGDELRLATDFRSKVIGVALKTVLLFYQLDILQMQHIGGTHLLVTLFLLRTIWINYQNG